ncbi:Clp protease N-terminal domain-containing protein [Tomitella fengzijianii]|uniref:Clp R domain-containing protein n=1 Tax=Tomitella fengzijianii TaxID=2597660 RepID=A0A516X0A7_9ACTN|nr:Clp protease N-terminal domain-containing protein [Tomitella fengzijianii]QDQ96515.1 hypothetical protein FO059_03145 [Tomitella fengzijianii]
MFERFARDARRIVIVAQDEAIDLGSAQVDPRHYLLAMLLAAEPPVRRVLEDAGFTVEQVRDDIRTADATVHDAAQDRPGTALNAEDVDALRSIGIDLDAVRESIEAQFGPEALSDEVAADDPAPDAGLRDEERPSERGRGRPGDRRHPDGDCGHGHGRGGPHGRRGRGRRGGGRFGRVRLDADAKRSLQSGLGHAVRERAGEITGAYLLLGVLSGASGPTKRLIETRTTTEALADRVKASMGSAA